MQKGLSRTLYKTNKFYANQRGRPLAGHKVWDIKYFIIKMVENFTCKRVAYSLGNNDVCRYEAKDESFVGTYVAYSLGNNDVCRYEAKD